MSTAEVPYSFRNRVPVTLHAGRDQVTAISAYYQGALVAVASGTYTLLGPTGSVVVDAEAITVPGGVATYELDGTTEIPATVTKGARWQERWALSMPDGTTRTVRRTAALAAFELQPPITDADLTGVYPDLLDSLGDYATHLQDWIDEGYSEVVRTLWKHQNFPHILVEPSDVYAWAREAAWAALFRSLFRSSRGEDERWRALWDHHRMKAEAEAGSCRIVVDRDGDGLQDDDSRRRAAPRSAEWNAPIRRQLPRKFQ